MERTDNARPPERPGCRSAARDSDGTPREPHDLAVSGISTTAALGDRVPTPPLDLGSPAPTLASAQRLAELEAGQAVAAHLITLLSSLVERERVALAADAATVPGYPAPGWGDLTERQRQGAHLLAVGKSDREIATILNIQRSTARGYSAGVLAKLRAHSRRDVRSLIPTPANAGYSLHSARGGPASQSLPS